MSELSSVDYGNTKITSMHLYPRRRNVAAQVTYATPPMEEGRKKENSEAAYLLVSRWCSQNPGRRGNGRSSFADSLYFKRSFSLINTKQSCKKQRNEPLVHEQNNYVNSECGCKCMSNASRSQSSVTTHVYSTRLWKTQKCYFPVISELFVGWIILKSMLLLFCKKKKY